MSTSADHIEHRTVVNHPALQAMQEHDLVTQDEIATHARVRINTVVSWVMRGQGFPTPAGWDDREPVWSWSEVEDWLRATGRQPSHAV
jgi:hypothetical protein